MKIFLSGPSASGKTTVAKKLSEYFGLSILPSVSRGTMAEMGELAALSDTEVFHSTLCKKQIANQLSSKNNFISDRSIFDIFTYARLFSDRVRFRESASRLLADSNEIRKSDYVKLIEISHKFPSVTDSSINRFQEKGSFSAAYGDYAKKGVITGDDVFYFIFPPNDGLIESRRNDNSLGMLNDIFLDKEYMQGDYFKIITGLFDSFAEYIKNAQEDSLFNFRLITAKEPEEIFQSIITSIIGFRSMVYSSDAIYQNIKPGILKDSEIRRIMNQDEVTCLSGFPPKEPVSSDYGWITPFVEKQGGVGKISRGLSSAGYDITLGEEIVTVGGRTFIETTGNEHPFVIDPLSSSELRERNFIKQKIQTDSQGRKYYDLSPHEYVLVPTVETFRMPDDVIALAVGKSTYARCGVIVNITPLEPGWRGVLTVEIYNASRDYVRIYCNHGIAQLLFFKTSGPVERDYSKRSSKYQDQVGVTLPK